MAKRMATMVWSMVCARTQRGMWFVQGWPNKFMAALAGGHQGRSIVDALRRDYDAFVRMKAAGMGAQLVDEWLRRSSMQVPCVVQLVRALRGATGRSTIACGHGCPGRAGAWSTASCAKTDSMWRKQQLHQGEKEIHEGSEGLDIDDCSGGHEPRPQVPAVGQIVGPLPASAHGDRRVLPHEAN